MKKLALVLAVTVASVFAVNAEPIGIKVGADVYDNAVLTTSYFSANPYLAYSNSALGFDLGLKVGYWATLTPAFSSDKVQFDVSGAKSFKISDDFSLAPSLTLQNEFITIGTTGYKLNVRPGVAATYAISTTFIQLRSYVPVGLVTETDLLLYADESVALGSLGLGAYLGYAIVPTADLSWAGVYASYPVGPVGLGLCAEFSGFKTTLDMALCLSVSYAF
ncbi:MAG: hypothetical protein WCT14_05830 [Treponemataceae bacterium]